MQSNNISDAIKKQKKSGRSGYAYNISKLSNILQILIAKGYKNLSAYSYFNSSPNRFVFHDALREVTGSDDFFKELCQNMNDADINYNGINLDIIKLARERLLKQLEDLYNICFGGE